MQPAAASFNVVVQLLPHALFPKLLDVVGYPSHGLVVRIAGKELGDLIRRVNH